MHKMIKYDAIDQDVSDCGSFVILHSYEDVTSLYSYKLTNGAISKPNWYVWQNWCNSNVIIRKVDVISIHQTIL